MIFSPKAKPVSEPSAPITHPEWRGRFFGQLNWQELPYNLTIQTQLVAISDKNFLDQYFNTEWTPINPAARG